MNERKLILARVIASIVCLFWVAVFLMIGWMGFIPMILLFTACSTSWKLTTSLAKPDEPESSTKSKEPAKDKPQPAPESKPFAGFQDIPNQSASSGKSIKQITHQP